MITPGVRGHPIEIRRQPFEAPQRSHMIVGPRVSSFGQLRRSWRQLFESIAMLLTIGVKTFAVKFLLLL
jgi:hypothetical protein